MGLCGESDSSRKERGPRRGGCIDPRRHKITQATRIDLSSYDIPNSLCLLRNGQKDRSNEMAARNCRDGLSGLSGVCTRCVPGSYSQRTRIYSVHDRDEVAKRKVQERVSMIFFRERNHATMVCIR